MFYDDFHFTIAGAARVAEFLADRLTAPPPFSEASGALRMAGAR